MSACANSSQMSIRSLSSHQFEREVDAQFRKFADNLKASQGYHDKGIRLCEAVSLDNNVFIN